MVRWELLQDPTLQDSAPFKPTTNPLLTGGPSKRGKQRHMSLPTLTSHRAKPSTAIERALEDPDACELDIGAMRTLRNLEQMWSIYRAQLQAPIAENVFSPALQSQAERELLVESGADLSRRYNALGMLCLDANAEVAFECLQRSLFTAQRDSPEQALALSHLGVHAQTQAKTNQALRYLRRAVGVSETCSLASRVRVRLNLCAALNELGEHARTASGKGASTPREDGAPGARLEAPGAQAAPTQPRAPAEQLGGLPSPRELGSLKTRPSARFASGRRRRSVWPRRWRRCWLRRGGRRSRRRRWRRRRARARASRTT